MTYNPWRWKMLFILWWHYAGYRCSFGPPAIVVFVEGAFVSEYHTKLVGGCYRNRVAITSLLVNNDAGSGNNDEINTKPSSGKFKIFHKIAFRHMSFDQRTIRETLVQAPRQKYRIRKPHELEDYFADTEYRFRKDNGAIDYDTLLNSLDVRGDTQVIGSPLQPNYIHPVAKLLHQRKREGRRSDDNAKVALAIEGGGMRGCVSAGMVCALHHLNLTESFDVVYGSSAGSIVGSYLITGQLPWFGPELYYDRLTTAGRDFIDTRRLLRALGFGLLDPRLLKDVITRPEHGKPVLNLPYLLQTTMQETKPLNWDKFVERQNTLPLKVVVSDLREERSRALDYQGGFFETRSELAECMHASCLLPGIAGPLMNMNMEAFQRPGMKKYILANNANGSNLHPLADALIYEPLPFHSAIKEGATHVVVMRSRPDGVDVTGKSSIFEKLIYRRFFLRKNRLPHIYQLMRQHMHKKLYGTDILRLNEAAYSKRDLMDLSEPHLMAIAMPPGSPEVVRLETGREAIFQGIRRGFARAYDCFVEDPKERGRGETVAQEYFPDEILSYCPRELSHVTNESAFEYHLRQSR